MRELGEAQRTVDSWYASRPAGQSLSEDATEAGGAVYGGNGCCGDEHGCTVGEGRTRAAATTAAGFDPLSG